MATRKKSSNSTKRRSTTRKSTSRKRSNNRNNLKFDLNENGLWDEAILFVLMALAVILLLSNFNMIGALGGFLSDVMFGLFGIMGYLFPICLLILLIYIFVKRDDYISVIKIGASIILFFIICTFSHLLVLKDQKNSSLSLYEFCKGDGAPRGGGIFGGLIATGLSSVISVAGTVILMLALAIVCFVLITEISVINGIKSGSKKAIRATMDDAERIKERRRIKNELRRQRELEQEELIAKKRAEKKVSGVSFDTKINDEIISPIKEITPEPDGISDSNTNDSSDSILDNYIDKEIVINSLNEETDTFIETESKADEYNKEFKISDLNPTEFSFSAIDTTNDYNTIINEPSIDREIIISDSEEIKLTEEEVSIPSTESKIIDKDDTADIFAVTKSTKTESVKRRATAPTKQDDLYKNAAGTFPEKNLSKGTSDYKLPSIELLNNPVSKASDSAEVLESTAQKLVNALSSFNVKVTMQNVSQGPAVTRYEMSPEAGTKVSKIVGLSDDIKLALAAEDVRIEAPVPGKSVIGIEVPNESKAVVSFREMMSSKEFTQNSSKIAFGLGKDIAGSPIVADIAKMPHLLIAGATGSGKSVCINTIIMSILYKANPDDVKLIMIDPKVVELSVYNGIPHLMIPVVTDPKKATAALAWGVAEMTARYEKFAAMQVRDLKGYNAKVETMNKKDNDGAPLKKLPQIVIIVDELADLMMVASKDVEEHICRLAQLARACGIHLIIATQRPSVDVITGLIKANMPSRIAFAVSSGVDSRTILDMVGAEKLLGKGDMLYYPQGVPKPLRIQGAFVSDEEVSAVVEDIVNRTKDYASTEKEEVLAKMQSLETSKETGASSAAASSDAEGGHDPLFAEVGKFIIDSNKASIGGLQRRFKIGFNRAARIVDDLTECGILGPEAGTKPREILMSQEQFEQWMEEYL